MKQLLFVLIVSGIFFYSSCQRDDDFITDLDAKLEFSTDTLTFDTVFTQIGSATRLIKVFNPHKQSILIDKILIGEGNGSRFRLNIDGNATNSASAIKIAGKDSLYIFVEVTVDPDDPISLSPFVFYDQIIFETNGNNQNVVLEAWGQNALYLPNRFGTGGAVGLTCSTGETETVWTKELPIVIFGIVVVTDCTLTIEAGTKIYVHGGLQSTFVENDIGDSVRVFYNDGRLILGENARLNIKGTVDEPVTIQGDRLEEDFQEEAGQWFGVVLSTESSSNHSIDYAIIKNSVFGVAVDSSANLNINNTKILNTSGNGLLGIHSKIEAKNCAFYNSGSNAVRFVQGGAYDFSHCTLASYGVDASALSMSDVRCLNPFCTDFEDGNGLNANFTNCIIFGSREDELLLTNLDQDSPYNNNFKNCIIKISSDALEDELYQTFLDDCENCINASTNDPLFFDVDENDYHLDTLSIAEQKATSLMDAELQFDLDGEERPNDMPDIGCYEYIYQ